MKVTFLVEINLDDLSSIADIAQEIQDDLSNFEVVSVKPWARPALQKVNPLSSLPSITET